MSYIISKIEIFDQLREIKYSENLSISDKYRGLLQVLMEVSQELSRDAQTSFGNFYSLLGYLITKKEVPKRETFFLQNFRVRANSIGRGELSPSEDSFLKDFKGLCFGVATLIGSDVPFDIKMELGSIPFPTSPVKKKGHRVPRIRVIVQKIQDDGNDVIIVAEETNDANEDPIHIRIGDNTQNNRFKSIAKKLWISAQLHLIDVLVTEDNEYHPRFLVLEPDYLIDVTTLAEVFAAFGDSPLNYIQKRMEYVPNTKAILLGNMANLFLDEHLNSSGKKPVIFYAKSPDGIVEGAFFQGFRQQPFEFSTCDELQDNANFISFMEEARTVFNTIESVVTNTFGHHNLHPDDIIVEPSFLSEDYGLQGRLDLLQLSKNEVSKIVELKSGKAPFPTHDLTLINENHFVQMCMYYLMLQGVFSKKSDELEAYIFYPKAPDKPLRTKKPLLDDLQRFIAKRNDLVYYDYKTAKASDGTIAKNIIESISVANIVKEGLHPNFLNFVVPPINEFQAHVNSASSLEKNYVFAFTAFIANELFVSKTGDGQMNNRGSASLWKDNFKAKEEDGTILFDLKLIENLSDTVEKSLMFTIPESENGYLPNFRKGDICVLYQRETETMNVLRTQIYKCNIEHITKSEVKVKLRFQQRKKEVFDSKTKWAIEPDAMDNALMSMHKNLYVFIKADSWRKGLILGVNPPKTYNKLTYNNRELNDNQNEIVANALASPDYFLVIGPPGTGKTKVILSNLVNEIYKDPNKNILLLAYTNQAVDEICESISKLGDSYSFIRLGSELSTKYKSQTLDVMASKVNSRAELKNILLATRLYIGTVASITARSELFRLKIFDVAIVDEASQILEPQIVGILSQAGKYILIGDHKQLPAIVVQNESEAEVPITLTTLHQIELKTRSNSYFQRMIDLSKTNNWTHAFGMLNTQGRMHNEIAWFPNFAFYQGKLQTLADEVTPNEPTRFKELAFKKTPNPSNLTILLSHKRLVFIPSGKDKNDKGVKIHTPEAKAVAYCVKHIYELYKERFNPSTTIGIITPYRRQIALIRAEVENLGIPALNNITIDTVERYQGSQRDVIIYSFCVSSTRQIENLQNIIIEDGHRIDRKLNVAITRAKQQMIFIGDPSYLSTDLLFYRLIEFVKTRSGYINEGIDGITSDTFSMPIDDPDRTIEGKSYEPTSDFQGIYEQLITSKIKSESFVYPNDFMGFSADVCRDLIINYGRANFEQTILSPNINGQLVEVSTFNRALMYSFFNMRKHYFSSLALFENFKDSLLSFGKYSHNHFVMIDIGCGPATSGLAMNHLLKSTLIPFKMRYLGIDISKTMMTLGEQFLEFEKNMTYNFTTSFKKLPPSWLDDWFVIPQTVICNGSYLFGNLNNGQAEELADDILELVNKYPLNRYIYIHQNPSSEIRNRSYFIFRKKLSNKFKKLTSKIETVSYKNQIMSQYDKSETVYYEILST